MLLIIFGCLIMFNYVKCQIGDETGLDRQIPTCDGTKGGGLRYLTSLLQNKKFYYYLLDKSHFGCYDRFRKRGFVAS
jgi:hypothetical protein